MVKRRLEAAGFVEASQKGSHVKFVRRVGLDIDIAIVPKKSEVRWHTPQHPQPSPHSPEDWDELA